MVPTSEELGKINQVENLRCYRVIAAIKQDAEKCIKHMKAIGDPLKFKYKRPGDNIGYCHVNRIVNAHSGYIGNFIGYLEEYYKYLNTLQAIPISPEEVNA